MTFTSQKANGACPIQADGTLCCGSQNDDSRRKSGTVVAGYSHTLMFIASLLQPIVRRGSADFY
jgi:hypothetical protein